MTELLRLVTAPGVTRLSFSNPAHLKEYRLMIGLALLSAPVGYVALTAYLLFKIRPLPIALVPGDMLETPSGRRAPVLAA
jgi:hypothetical protein